MKLDLQMIFTFSSEELFPEMHAIAKITNATTVYKKKRNAENNNYSKNNENNKSRGRHWQI